jgi:hypothetical protein
VKLYLHSPYTLSWLCLNTGTCLCSSRLFFLWKQTLHIASCCKEKYDRITLPLTKLISEEMITLSTDESRYFTVHNINVVYTSSRDGICLLISHHSAKYKLTIYFSIWRNLRELLSHITVITHLFIDIQ